MSNDIARIAALNDNFRQTFVGGAVVLTKGVMAVAEHTRKKLVREVQAFTDFGEGNDPFHEHDFGKVDIDGNTFFFQIAYYDHTLNAASPDPTDPTKTRRVMTIMLNSEY